MSKAFQGGTPYSRYALAVAALATVTGSASAALSTGGGGRGVVIGQSSLIGTLDYSDDMTGTSTTNAPRWYQGGLRPQEAYNVQNVYGNTPQQFTQTRDDGGVSPPRPNMSFAADNGGTSGPGLSNGNANQLYPGTSGAGSSNGFTQAGVGTAATFDYGIPYLDSSGFSSLRHRFVVQFDAIQTPGQVHVNVGPAAGSIVQRDSLTIAFNGDNAADAARANKVSLITYTTTDGLTFTPVETVVPGITTGLAGSRQWHNYAAKFDADANKVEIYLDEQSLGVVDLTTFAGGAYAGFSTDAINVGASAGTGTASTGAGNRVWTDNVQVGSVAVPEPMAAGFVGIGCLATLLRRRGRRTGQR
jgi:hypothetical protein